MAVTKQVIKDVGQSSQPHVFLNGNTKKIFDIVGRVVFISLSLFVGVVAYEGKNLIQGMQDHEKRISKIEGNRYTSNDALADMRRINASVVDLRTWIEDKYPPTWLKQDVEELKLEVRSLRLQMLQNSLIQDTP